MAELREKQREEEKLRMSPSVEEQNGGVLPTPAGSWVSWIKCAEASSFPLSTWALRGASSALPIMSPSIPVARMPLSPWLGPSDSPDAGTVTTGPSSLWGCWCGAPGPARGAAAAPHYGCGPCPAWAWRCGRGPGRAFSAPGWRPGWCCFSCSRQKGRQSAAQVARSPPGMLCNARLDVKWALGGGRTAPRGTAGPRTASLVDDVTGGYRKPERTSAGCSAWAAFPDKSSGKTLCLTPNYGLTHPFIPFIHSAFLQSLCAF